jgi:hypothetical protein
MSDRISETLTKMNEGLQFYMKHTGFEVLTAVVMKSSVF